MQVLTWPHCTWPRSDSPSRTVWRACPVYSDTTLAFMHIFFSPLAGLLSFGLEMPNKAVTAMENTTEHALEEYRLHNSMERRHLRSIFFFNLGQMKNHTTRAQITEQPTEIVIIPHRGILSNPSTREKNKKKNISHENRPYQKSLPNIKGSQQPWKP